MRNFLWSRLVVGVLLLVVSSAALPGAGMSQRVPTSGRYIVLLKDDGSHPGQRAAEHGKAHGLFKPSHVYRHALRGYAATLPAQAADAIRKRPDVLSVSEDGEVRLQAEQPPQVISFGVLHIGGDKSSTRSGNGRGVVNVNVAVLDDGGPVKHVDLNVVGSTSCVSRTGPSGNIEAFGGHGTMVGGFIGALDNGIGRVGIAPGARLWAVRVVDKNGFGFDSEIICGLDWVTATRTDGDPNNDIAVANMSLSGPLRRGVSNGSCADSPDAQRPARSVEPSPLA
jgi:subtilisin